MDKSNLLIVYDGNLTQKVEEEIKRLINMLDKDETIMINKEFANKIKIIPISMIFEEGFYG